MTVVESAQRFGAAHLCSVALRSARSEGVNLGCDRAVERGCGIWLEGEAQPNGAFTRRHPSTREEIKKFH